MWLATHCQVVSCDAFKCDLTFNIPENVSFVDKELPADLFRAESLLSTSFLEHSLPFEIHLEIHQVSVAFSLAT